MTESFFFLSNIFLSRKNTHQVRCCHFLIVKIINVSVNLIQMSKQNRKLYHHDGEQLGFDIKSTYQNTEQNEVCSCSLYVARNEWVPIYLTKTVLKRTSNSIFNKEIVDLEELQWTGKLQVTRLYFLKDIMLAHFQRLFGRYNRDVFSENEGKIHEGGCVEELFSWTCRLASCNFNID